MPQKLLKIQTPDGNIWEAEDLGNGTFRKHKLLQAPQSSAPATQAQAGPQTKTPTAAERLMGAIQGPPPGPNAVPSNPVNPVNQMNYDSARSSVPGLSMITPEAQTIQDMGDTYEREGLLGLGKNILTRSIPTVTGGLGGLVAGAPGWVAGNVGGAALAQKVDEWRGITKPVDGTQFALNTALEAGINMATDGLGNVAGRAATGMIDATGQPQAGRLFKTMYKNTVKNSTNPADWEFYVKQFNGDEDSAAAYLFDNKFPSELKEMIMKNPDMPVTAGQVTGSRNSTLLESAFQGDKREAIIKKQQEVITKRATEIARMNGQKATPEVLASQMKDTVTTAYDDSRAQINSMFKNLREEARKYIHVNPEKTGPPIKDRISGQIMKGQVLEPEVQISGPVWLPQAKVMATEYLETYARMTGGKTAEEMLAKASTTEERAMLESMRRIAALGDTEAIPLDLALEIKAFAGNKGFVNFAGDSTQGRWKFLNKQLDEDIKKSLGQIDKSGKLISQYTSANRLNTTHMEKYLEDKAMKGLVSADGKYPVEQFRAALRSPQTIDTVLNEARKFGGQANFEVAQRTFRSEFAEDLLQRTLRPDGTFDVNTGLKILTDRDNQEVLRRIMTPQHKKAFERLLTGAQQLAPKATHSGEVGVDFALGRAGMSASGGFLETLLSPGDGIAGGLKSGAKGLVGLLGMKEYVKRALMDPEIVRSTLVLQGSNPTSQQAKTAARNIKLAFKGTQIYLQSRDGKRKITATVGQTPKEMKNAADDNIVALPNGGFAEIRDGEVFIMNPGSKQSPRP